MGVSFLKYVNSKLVLQIVNGKIILGRIIGQK